MKLRYSKVVQALTADDICALHEKKVCVIGCGGLGGYIVEAMARIGVLNITVADKDVFDISNLNRQRFSSESVIGMNKVDAAKQCIAAINSDVILNAVKTEFNGEKGMDIIWRSDLVFDALDNVADRLLLAKMCADMNIPLVHGAIGGWVGQVASIYPGDNTLNVLYKDFDGNDDGEATGSLPFMALAVAALQCAEAIKILTKKGEPLRNAFMRIDTLTNEYTVIRI